MRHNHLLEVLVLIGKTLDLVNRDLVIRVGIMWDKGKMNFMRQTMPNRQLTTGRSINNDLRILLEI